MQIIRIENLNEYKFTSAQKSTSTGMGQNNNNINI